MKEIKLGFSSNGHMVSAIMELGKHYKVTDEWKRSKNYMLIRTGEKGFNLLNLKSSKCLFNRPVYQTSSALLTITRNQKIFEINMPDFIKKIERYDENEIVEETKPSISDLLPKPKKEKPPVITSSRNALYRMEV